MKMNYNAIKGELVLAHVERLKDMHTDEVGVIYDKFYIDLASIMYDINRIDSLDSLSKFCDDYGLNDRIYPGLSFPELISVYYE